MKKIFLLVFISFLAIVFVITASAQKYPEFSDGTSQKEGDLLVCHGFYKNKRDKDFPKRIKADYMTIAVRENRNHPQSRLIAIPVLRIHSLSRNPLDPVFLLNGGPGESNLVNFAVWLLDKHDVVMVGYRGVDGSTKLYSRAFADAMVIRSGSFSQDHMREIGSVLNKELGRFKSEGVDLNGYNIVEVVDDIETVRDRLGYKKINFYSCSYGTRLAYIFGLRYPENVSRSLMTRVNPPGHFCYDSEILDGVLKEYGEIWKSVPSNLRRSPDIVQTVKNVLAALPAKWKKIDLDRGKIRFMMFLLLYSVNGASQLFDAFHSAENGDCSGLACLVMMFDMTPQFKIAWLDLIVKGVTADYVPGRDYVTGTDSGEGLMGAIHSKLFAMYGYSGYALDFIPERYRKLDFTHVDTLLVNGNLDIATPKSNVQEMIGYLPNGKLIILGDCSHSDLERNQRSVFRTMAKEYFRTGRVETKGFRRSPADLRIPEKRLQKMGKIFYFLKKLGLLKLIAKMAM